MEAVLSLQHILRVAKAVNVDLRTLTTTVVAYIADEMDRDIVAHTWHRRMTVQELDRLAIVVVKGLPRGARVEWHVLRCMKHSDEGLNPTHGLYFDDEVDSLYGSGLEAGLCMTFGDKSVVKKIKSRHPEMVVQRIPSKAVYCVGVSGKYSITKHKSCIALLEI